MSTTAGPEQPRSASQVLVAVSGISRDDAETVFGVLRTAYASDQATADLPQDAGEGRPTVWTSVFEVADPRAEPRPASLTAPVTADLQGGPLQVRQMADVLARAFEVRERGAVAGDQERELRLRLSNSGIRPS
ncbi:hypothetical protein VT50_0235805 [Streptomyces antioxidans]|uniref:Uncharacterized protein n=1 Tax=Streptomyces antioxidans TaxID=1507734 RepID=A0A1V4CUA0_9ACTN|nr:hypothetical protein [Streptomyces antioxidans]OPF70804.1 hypothetical protein VT50_0235805 [Streptomyces antioxidans]